jgi:tetratricopeptide (TPR) repeat protein
LDLDNTDRQYLREQIEALDPDNWLSRLFQDQALAATSAGDLDETKLLLEGYIEARRSSVSAATKLFCNVAAAEAALGWIAMAQSRYNDAARHFRFAGQSLPEKETGRRVEYGRAEADSYYRQAEEHADEGALRQAIDLSRPLLREPRERRPTQWVTLLMKLGAALQKIGARDGDTVCLEEAAAAYRAVLEVFPRRDAPVEWAMTQNDLGVTLSLLVERQSSGAPLKEACAAFRAALEVRTRESVPFDWAVTQTNLGNVLLSLGRSEGGTARLKEAETAYLSALDLFQAARASAHVKPIKASLAEAERLLAERARERKRGWITSFPMAAMMLSKIRAMQISIPKIPRIGLRRLLAPLQRWRTVGPSPPTNANTSKMLLATSATGLAKKTPVTGKTKDDPHSLHTSECPTDHQAKTRDPRLNKC